MTNSKQEITDIISIYITTRTKEEALEIAKFLIENKLAACANIIPGVISLYSWDKKIQQEEETIVFIKTRASLYPQVEQKVMEMHSYEYPCILSFPIFAGQENYINWIKSSLIN